MTIPKYETILISVTDAKKPYAGELMKMEHASHCRDEYYLLWDADTQPCRQIRMFSEEGMPYLDIRKELREGLYETIELLVPGLAKVIEKSFICEHQLIKTEYMRELIAEIEANGQIPGGLDMDFKSSVVAVLLGVLLAAIIMGVGSLIVINGVHLFA